VDDVSHELFQEVWYQNHAELEARAIDASPFVIVAARSQDYNTLPRF
jgi:hypothetical protein